MINKYRVLYALGVTAFFFTIAYSVIYGEWLLLLGSYLWARFVGIMGNQIALHRYFSHRSFKTTKAKHVFLSFFSVLGGEASPIAWSTHHRHHHKHSDSKLDVHSPYESVTQCLFTWPTKPLNWWLEEKKIKTVTKDLLRDPTVKFVDAHYYKIWTFLVLVSFAISWKFCIFFVLAPIGHSMVNAGITNFCGHWKLPGSYRTFETTDKTYNNKFVALYLGGEGLHNNHHHDMTKYDQAFNPGEFDLSAWIVKNFLEDKKEV